MLFCHSQASRMRVLTMSGHGPCFADQGADDLLRKYTYQPDVGSSSIVMLSISG